MNHFQYHINSVVAALYNNGLRHVVISPGSRNAPIIMAFVRFGKFTCHSAIDERAAGFMALGLAKQTQTPAAVVCTSGSALANIYPAVLEAYYMQVPLLVLSADRPAAMIDRWDGQTIHQFNIFDKHIKGSFTCPEIKETDQTELCIAAANAVYQAANGAMRGPAHLNMPLNEPLYEAVKSTFEYPELSPILSVKRSEPVIPQGLKNILHQSDKVMLLFGADYSDCDITELKANNHVVVMADMMSNRRQLQTASNWEAVLLQKDNASELMPEVLITFGKMVLNKSLKLLLRQTKVQHWHIDVSGYCADTFNSAPQTIDISQSEFLNWLNEQTFSQSSNYMAVWKSQSIAQKEKAVDLGYGELLVMAALLKQIPDQAVLHLSNSMTVRNAAYMAPELSDKVKVHCNRGVSGIDGCTSTAIGMALADPDHQHYLMTGDVAFLYDVNAFLTPTLPANLSVLIFNNGGGGIFKILDGPSDMPELNPYVFTPHAYDLSHIAKMHGLNFQRASNMNEVQEAFKDMQQSKACSLLEIQTDAAINSQQFKQYKSNKI